MCDNKNSDLELSVISFVKQTRNELHSEELYRRKKTLQDYNEKIFPEDIEFSQSTYQQIFADCYLQVLSCVRDKSETCRDLAIQLLTKFITHLDLNDYYLTYIFPVVVERIGSVELVEESEEIRLELLNFLIVIVTRYANTECLVPFLNDIVQILCQTAIDKYPKIKEASCKCIIELAAALPKHFHLQCETLVKPVLQSFVHQHYRVRVIAIKAIGEIILHSSSASIIENTVGPLAEKLFDSIPTVRQTVAQVATRLLTEYRDRYSHFHRLLPLILTGLCDEIPETRTQTEVLWAVVGKQYEKENETDLKDQMDFPVSAVDHYPAGVVRPNLGCRVLVQRNASKMIPGLCNELTSWQDDIRIRCAQLLCAIVLHCEQFFTQCLQDALPAMYLACADQERRVWENMMTAARVIGALVPVWAWSALVLPAVYDSPTYGHLRVLRSLATGTPSTDLATISVELAELLASETVRCGNRKALYQTELVECCRTITAWPTVSGQVFEVLVSVVAMGTGTEYLASTEAARKLLTDVQDSGRGAAMLLARFAEGDAAMWTVVSSDRCIFDTLLLEWNHVLLPHLSLVGAVLVRALDPRCDPEARLRTYQALSTFLQDDLLPKQSGAGNPTSALATFVQHLVQDILVPALVWHAGRTAEALRTAAAFCLSQTLPHASSLPAMEDAAFNQFLALLSTLLEDASWRTRLYSIRSLTDLGRLLANDPARRCKWTNDSAVALVKRLDDPTDAIRVAALQSLRDVTKTASVMETQNMRYLVDSVLMHMDDEDRAVKEVSLDVLKEVSRGNKTYLMEKLANDKHMFRDGSACDELMDYLNNLCT